jgi:adiponectin receptor
MRRAVGGAESAPLCPHGRPTCGENNIRCIDCVPEYVKNDHIIGGYRFNMSYWQATKSLFALHNETFNVWTHLLGIVFFLYLFFFVVLASPTIHDRVVVLEQQVATLKSNQLAPFLTSAARVTMLAELQQEYDALAASWQDFRSKFVGEREHRLVRLMSQLDTTLEELHRHLQSSQVGQDQLVAADLQLQVVRDINLLHSELTALASSLASNEDSHYVPLWPMTIYIASVICCFLFSTLFHLYCAVGGEDVHLYWRKLDYAGISVLISGSYIPIMYYMTELGSYRVGYIASAFIIAGGVISFTLTDNAYKEEYRTFRACLYVAFGLFGLVPGLHTIWIVSGGHPAQSFVLYVFLRTAFMGFLYIFGAFLYVRRIPERWWVGHVDIFFQSHQFFHILVILAALVHFGTSLDMWHLAHYHSLS